MQVCLFMFSFLTKLLYELHYDNAKSIGYQHEHPLMLISVFALSLISR